MASQYFNTNIEFRGDIEEKRILSRSDLERYLTGIDFSESDMKHLIQYGPINMNIRDWLNILWEKGVRSTYLNPLYRSNKIKRGECEFKNETCSKGIIQAHHEDYNKPLEINWLCPSHHKKVDLGIMKLNKQNKKI